MRCWRSCGRLRSPSILIARITAMGDLRGLPILRVTRWNCGSRLRSRNKDLKEVTGALMKIVVAGMVLALAAPMMAQSVPPSEMLDAATLRSTADALLQQAK